MKHVFQIAGLALCALWAMSSSQAQMAEGELNEAEILEFLQSQIPKAYEILLVTRTSDPSGYQEQLRGLGSQIAYYEQVKKRSPAYAEGLLRAQSVLIESQSIAGQLKSEKPGKNRDTLVQELRALLDEQFELELEKPELEVEFLEKEVLRLRDLIEQQRASRDAIVELRLQALTGEEAGRTR